MHSNKIQFSAFILWEATNFCFWNIFWNLLFGLETGKEGFFNYPRIYFIVAGIILACLQWFVLKRISSIKPLSWIIVTLIGMQIGTLSVYPAFALLFLLGSLLIALGYKGYAGIIFFMVLMTTTSTSIWIFQAYVLKTVQYLGWIKSISWVGIQFLINVSSILTAALIFDIPRYFNFDLPISTSIFTFQLIVSLFNLLFYYFWVSSYNKA